MAGLNTNLKAAEEAVAYVKSKMTLGASNTLEDLNASGAALRHVFEIHEGFGSPRGHVR